VGSGHCDGDPGLLAMALVGRWTQSFRSGGPGERLSIGGELLAVSGKPVTAEAVARAVLMAASCGTADFYAADWHAAEAARSATGTRPVSWEGSGCACRPPQWTRWPRQRC
jgi:hypothetical protein